MLSESLCFRNPLLILVRKILPLGVPVRVVYITTGRLTLHDELDQTTPRSIIKAAELSDETFIRVLG